MTTTKPKRGLGKGLGDISRGIGALIPTAPESADPVGDVKTPVDVFFTPSTPQESSTSTGSPAKKASHRAGAWDSAMSTGRVGLKPGVSAGGKQKVATASAPAAGRVSPVAAADLPASTQGPDSAEGLVPVPGARFAEIPVTAISPNKWQPRTTFDQGDLDELVASIREIGVLQPIVVRPSGDDSGQYELIMGERRWRASQQAGRETIPAIVRETGDSDMLRDALLENLHRADLNPLEEAAAYRQLLDDFACTHEELATRIARSRPQISNTLRLLKLPPLVQRRVAAGVLSAGHARALLGLDNPAQVEQLAQRIVAEGLSVRAVEEIVTLTNSGDTASTTHKTASTSQANPAIQALAGRLADRFDTRVKVLMGKSKGRLTVEFASPEDLNRILALMAPDIKGVDQAG